MDSSGNALVVWSQWNGANYQIFKSEYRSGSWTHPANIADNISPDGQDAINPRVAMDDNGNALITWQQNDGTRDQIYKSEYRSSSWTHPANLADNISPDTAASNPQVAMDNNGNALIVWQQPDGAAVSQTFKSEYRTGSWTHPANSNDNISPDVQAVTSPAVAMDNNGNAVIVWVQNDGTRNQIFKSEYRTGSWTHPANLADNISPDSAVVEPQVAMDDSGNAIIAWRQPDAGAIDQIFKSEYRAGSWTHPANLADNISPDGQNSTTPWVAMSDNGSAVIVWGQWDGTADHIYRSEYRSGSWTHPANLADKISASGFAYEPQVAMDNTGNALIVWYEYDGTANYQAFKSEYRNGAWTDPAGGTDNISPDGQDVAWASTAMSDGGNALIVFNQNDGTNDLVYLSEYR